MAVNPSTCRANAEGTEPNVLVTHYQRILNYITPDFVHVLVDGRIVRSGGKELAEQLEEKGYDWIRESSEPPAAPTAAKVGA